MLTSFEHMFEHEQMSAPVVLVPRDQQLQQLQDSIARMQDGLARVPLPTHPALADLLQLRTGGAYQVDRASLGLALLSAASQEGSWTAVVGAADIGVEAAAELGIDLTRTVLVPDPGEQWVEATAALIDVVSIVLLRPPGDVPAHTASKLAARLRKRSAALVVWGRWPGAEARLRVHAATWSGATEGHGRLRSRQVRLGVQAGSAPERLAELWFPSATEPLERVAADRRTALDERGVTA